MTTASESLAIAILTVSDTRTLDTDTSGQYLADAIEQAGHILADRQLVADDIYQQRAIVSAWIADPDVEAILVTGGTGFTGRDSTPEALSVLFDKTVDGFGELFRHLSYQEIGTSTIQSRALAGFANATVIFCLPGSTGACKTAWQGIIQSQLDSTFKPCNFVGHLKGSH
ncbi:molybdenum cofactor biosynthesis protein B [Alteromonas sp. chi3]|uniref:Molybdenum cofactor biosynthesis protein B n=2 Tax=Alteromonas gilva TaxID=2987522 RepID=A0ABT5L1H2_9ALTE|nr:molybdenum cofactor biosynthesis protein B [Alteromonas gilva]MDC8830728.1 molybdenum cofactor biosynthesis protein B [Alteromonas gilva]